MNCSSLRNLYLSNNKFNGSFFNNLSSIAAEVKATNIQELFIAYNKFTGTVPNDDTLVTLFPNMTMFHIFENQFIGVMPILPVTKWKYLTEYRVSSNNFTGSNLSTFDEIVRQYQHTPTHPWNCTLKVFSMSFNRNVTSGSLPMTLSACTNMSTFEANEINMGGGTLPDDYGRAWAGSITTFSLHACNLSGTVPMSYSQWSLIEHFDVGVNSSLHGDLSFANKWRALKTIRLESNLFTGTIPDGFSKNINLTQLWLNGNQLHGTLDSAFGAGCPALRYFYVHTNNFSGTIPMEFASWPVMERFYIQNNRFEGTLQKAWAQWGSTFAEMNIGNNSFSGNLPAEWSAWGNVVVLMAAINSISGVLPISWEKMKHLGTLALDANQLTGSLPSQWSGLTSMNIMSLTYNQLSGTLPREWASLAKLQFLGLQGNANISGDIPSTWKSSLTGLFYMSICSTALYGNPWAPTLFPSPCFPCLKEGTAVSSFASAFSSVLRACALSNGSQAQPLTQAPMPTTPSTSSAASLPPPSPSPSARDAAGVSIIGGAGVVAILGGDPASAQMLVTLLMSSCMCGYSGDGGALSSGGSDDGVFATIVSSLTLSPFSSLGNAAMCFGNSVLMFGLVGLHALLVVLLGRRKERRDRRQPHSDENNAWRALCARPEASAAKFPNICVTCGLFLVPGVVRGSVMVLGTSSSSTLEMVAAVVSALLLCLYFVLVLEWLIYRVLILDDISSYSSGFCILRREALLHFEPFAIEYPYSPPLPRPVAAYALGRGGVWSPSERRNSFGKLVAPLSPGHVRWWVATPLLTVLTVLLSSVPTTSTAGCDALQGTVTAATVIAAGVFGVVRPYRAVLVSLVASFSLLVVATTSVLGLLCRHDAISVVQVLSVCSTLSYVSLVGKVYVAVLPFVEQHLLIQLYEPSRHRSGRRKELRRVLSRGSEETRCFVDETLLVPPAGTALVAA
ncbi:GP46-like surface antigen, putative, partial [Bodo saltans]